jgi:hypothetical protein
MLDKDVDDGAADGDNGDGDRSDRAYACIGYSYADETTGGTTDSNMDIVNYEDSESQEKAANPPADRLFVPTDSLQIPDGMPYVTDV